MKAVKKNLLPVRDALAAIVGGATPKRTATVPLDVATGRVLSEPIFALRTQPPFPASAMDGYAVRHVDMVAGTRLQVIGEAAAGHPFSGRVGVGQAVRIFTGGVVPEGADTILIQEDAHVEGSFLLIKDIPAQGSHIRSKGLDFEKGALALEQNSVLSPASIALAAACGHAELMVWKRPRIGILATGDELRLPGETTGPGDIVASNSFGIASMCRLHGAEPVDLGIARDNRHDLDARIEKASQAQCDVVVTLGGASVGDHDLVHAALQDAGFAMAFWKVAMRPGKPLIYGTRDRMRALGLPGNPVSALVCAHVFLVPLMRQLAGLPIQNTKQDATLTHDLSQNGDREHYMRAQLGADGSVRVFNNQDSSVLSLMASANCLVIRPPNAAAKAAGDKVTIIPL